MNSSNYDRSVRMWDEPHAPIKIDSLIRAGKLNKGKFLTEAHQDSYLIQLRTIHNLGVKKVLEIGPGENMVGNYLKSLGLNYETMDIPESSFESTIVGRLEDFDPKHFGGRWELVCAFQMLEHSPYENFIKNVIKMAFMSSNYVFISLPRQCAALTVKLQLSLGQKVRIQRHFNMSFPFKLRQRRYREEFMKEFPWAVHYWEIGRGGHTVSSIVGDIKRAGLELISEFPSGNPYHHFFLLKKREC